jgi:prefoldin beta subunit
MDEQLIETNLQNIIMQKHSLQSKLVETESALRELKNSKDAFKIVGNILVEATPKELTKELTKKQETLNLRIETLDSQEESLREEIKKLRK